VSVSARGAGNDQLCKLSTEPCLLVLALVRHQVHSCCHVAQRILTMVGSRLSCVHWSGPRCRHPSPPRAGHVQFGYELQGHVGEAGSTRCRAPGGGMAGTNSNRGPRNAVHRWNGLVARAMAGLPTHDGFPLWPATYSAPLKHTYNIEPSGFSARTWKPPPATIVIPLSVPVPPTPSTCTGPEFANTRPWHLGARPRGSANTLQTAIGSHLQCLRT
jgi:hypothetical protein